jgi:undecaprenyl-diphosphatase
MPLFLPMDWSVVHSLNHFLVRNDGIEDPLKVYVQIAEALFLAILLVVCVFARHVRGRPYRRTAVAAGLSAALALVVTAIVAHLVSRARPFVAHPNAVHMFLAHARDSSFPSDHATASAAVAIAILLRRKWAWGLLMVVLALILDFGRVALGLHYPTDILGGAAIGAAAALVLWAPPIRRWVDWLSDTVGRIGDGAIDAVLGRLTPGFGRSYAIGADPPARVGLRRTAVGGEDRPAD